MEFPFSQAIWRRTQKVGLAGVYSVHCTIVKIAASNDFWKDLWTSLSSPWWNPVSFLKPLPPNPRSLLQWRRGQPTRSCSVMSRSSGYKRHPLTNSQSLGTSATLTTALNPSRPTWSVVSTLSFFALGLIPYIFFNLGLIPYQGSNVLSLGSIPYFI